MRVYSCISIQHYDRKNEIRINVLLYYNYQECAVSAGITLVLGLRYMKNIFANNINRNEVDFSKAANMYEITERNLIHFSKQQKFTNSFQQTRQLLQKPFQIPYVILIIPQMLLRKSMRVKIYRITS